MDDYYVYIHRRLDNNEIFYVGKGNRRRAFSKTSRTNAWKEVVNVSGFSVEFVRTEMNDPDASALEKEVISQLGKENLCNMTDGGRGSNGFKHSDETRQKMRDQRQNISQETRNKISLTSKGRKPPPFSAETRKKMSDAKKGKPTSEANRARLREVNKGNKYTFGMKMTESAKAKRKETLRLKKEQLHG